MDGPLQQGETSKRIPVYTTDQRRPGSGNPGGNPQLWEQSYINCYPEVYHNATTFYEREFGVITRPPLVASTVLANTIASYGTIGTMQCLANIAINKVKDVCICAFLDTTAGDIYILQYRPIAGTTVKIGTITGATVGDSVYLTEIIQSVAGVLTPGVAVSYIDYDDSAGCAAYYAVTTSNLFTAASLTAISSASFPTNVATPLALVGGFQQIDGVSYIMTLNGQIWGSGGTGGTIYDITSWNTSNVVQASQYPDFGIGCFRFKNVLLAVMQDSIEFFVDGGGPPPTSPLVRTDQAFIKFGAISAKLICNVDDTIYWVSGGSSGAFGVWMLDGYTPTKISTSRIDQALATTYNAVPPGPTDILCPVILNMKKHVCINTPGGAGLYRNLGYEDTTTFSAGTETYPIIPSADFAANLLCYNIEDKLWWGMALNNTSGNNDQAEIQPATVTVDSASGTIYHQYIFCTTSGTLADVNSTLLFTFNNNCANGAYIDGFSHPAVICSSIQFNTYWFGTEKRKRIDKMKVICNQMENGSGDANQYVMWICYNRDDYDSSNGIQFARPINIPPPTNRFYISKLGMARNISAMVACKSANAFRCLGLELDLQTSTS